MSSGETNAELIQMAREAWAVDWVTAVCMSCLLYDWLITLDQEINRMWPAPFSIPKVLFFLNRYVVVCMLVFNAIASSLTHLSISVCKGYLPWLVVTITVTNAVVEGILITRVWALFRSNKVERLLSESYSVQLSSYQPVLWFALFFYVGGIITLVGLTIDDYVGTGPVKAVNDFNILPGCYAAGVPPIIAGYWIAPVIIESIMFVLIVSRVIIWWHNREPVPPTLILIARDSAIYYTAIFVLLMTNLFVFEFASPFLSSMMVTPSNTVGSIAGSRMLLNLRGINDPALTEFEPGTTEIEFAPNPAAPTATIRGRRRGPLSFAAILSGLSSVGTVSTSTRLGTTTRGREPSTTMTGRGTETIQLGKLREPRSSEAMSEDRAIPPGELESGL
ncbi:hypothetical protein PUNSTDRAFT_147044 [Punctularia strigosozonata HHB-11173 SS5]|uniref:DUF6533 domain-containing protein n=1 Tax=Punctularia strigosozonata (strain HHB-11173) TaxID=741275 RepID=R7RZB5_PUNST|nr:uncharacterized protein PUNSTDRAFT_147044 [Punctularia strigosozonata HHB-11173 SS5]EIN03460.1 hypothetical protein PUNSTDRAFT_147044 [Punctularia strigosozonata HHB-11173 SS5]